MNKNKERYYPIPGAIDGGDWNIDEAVSNPPQVSLNKRGPGGTMFVPLDESERSRYVRYHELGHVKYSPKQIKNQPDDVPDWVLGACEDARVTELLSRHAPPEMETTGFTYIERLYNAKQALESDNDLFLASLLMSKEGTHDYMKLLSTLYELAGDEDRETRHRITKTSRLVRKVCDARIINNSDTRLKNFSKTSMKAAEDLVRLFADPENERSEGDQEQEWNQEDFEEMYEKFLEELLMEESGYEEHAIEDDVVWGDMKVFRFSMHETLPPKLRAPHRRASDRGVNPRNIHRWCSDKAVFSRKVRAQGGTVLIDGSGSMGWTHEQLVETVETIPAGTVAIYSGPIADYSKRHNCKMNDKEVPYGALRIIAHEGRYIGDEVDAIHELPTGEQVLSGNLIDGPALVWLSQQEGPRIWVSDARVVGWSVTHESHLSNSAIYEYCLDLVKRHRITRLDHLEEVKKYMKGMKV